MIPETDLTMLARPTAPQGCVERCPCCGQTYPDSRICAPFVPQTSRLLDMVVLAQDVLADLKAALEQKVMP